MLASAELGQSLSRQSYEAELPALRAKLLQAHLDLRGRKFPVVLIVSGADGSGKGELVHRLNEWLDPRGVETQAFWATSEEERERPPFWRFWRALPGRGRIGILFGSWYTQPIISRVCGETKRDELDSALDRIANFEQMLVADGALFVKLWLHLPRKIQKKRLRKLEDEGRLAPDDWKHFKLYDRFAKVSERALRRTDTGGAPWQVIEATDRRFREFTAGTILLDALRARLDAGPAPAVGKRAPPPAAKPRAGAKSSILDHVDLTPRLTDAEYARQLDNQQAALSKLAWAAHEKIGRAHV